MMGAFVKKHVRRGILEVESWAKWFGFCLSVVERRWECGVCYAVGIVEILLIVDTANVSFESAAVLETFTGL
jgi:hypothetical protein